MRSQISKSEHVDLITPVWYVPMSLKIFVFLCKSIVNDVHLLQKIRKCFELQPAHVSIISRLL